MDKFRAFRIDEKDGNIVAGFQELSLDDLTEGNVVVRAERNERRRLLRIRTR